MVVSFRTLLVHYLFNACRGYHTMVEPTASIDGIRGDIFLGYRSISGENRSTLESGVALEGGAGGVVAAHAVDAAAGRGGAGADVEAGDTGCRRG
jgi:hypothetical protein